MKTIELTMQEPVGLKVSINAEYISHFLEIVGGCAIVSTNGVVLRVSESYVEVKRRISAIK